MSQACGTCGNVGENWLCLSCSAVFCSRYVNSHMVDHNTSDPSHDVSLSFSDLSVWCYSCDSCKWTIISCYNLLQYILFIKHRINYKLNVACCKSSKYIYPAMITTWKILKLEALKLFPIYFFRYHISFAEGCPFGCIPCKALKNTCGQSSWEELDFSQFSAFCLELLKARIE